MIFYSLYSASTKSSDITDVSLGSFLIVNGAPEEYIVLNCLTAFSCALNWAFALLTSSVAIWINVKIFQYQSEDSFYGMLLRVVHYC